MKIYSAALTNCGVVQEGHAVRLDFIDDKGTEVSLELSFERAQAIAKVLPSLLALTGNASSRFVLTLDRWTVEQSNDGNGLLLALAAGDGYEVCIDIPTEACRGLGFVLGSYKGAVTGNLKDRTATASSKALN